MKFTSVPVLTESCLQHVYCSIGRHGQRQSFLSDDKVLRQPSVNKAILGEFQSKMIVFWQQYGNENSLGFYLGRFWFIDLKLCMRVFIDIAYKLKKKLRQSERVTLAFRKPGLSSTCEDHLFN